MKKILSLMFIFALPFSLFASGKKELPQEQQKKPDTELPKLQEKPQKREGDPGQAFSAISEKLRIIGFGTPDKPLPAPDFSLKTLQGETRSLSSYQGSIVFLNFFATWCGPCRAEMPSMEVLYNTLNGEKFVILAVDLQEERSTVERFIQQNRLTFPVLLDERGGAGKLYGVQAIPTSYVIDKTGKIIAGMTGGREWDSEEVIALFRELAQ